MIKEKYQNKYRIKSSRLPDWDYASAGYYFVTISTKNRECLFGNIRHCRDAIYRVSVNNVSVCLTEIGKIAHKYWQKISVYAPFVELDEYVIMPNHIHGILQINCNENKICRDARNRDAINRVSTTMEMNTGGITKTKNPMNKKSLSHVMLWYKRRVSYEIRRNDNNLTFQWQPRFYDQIIRNEQSLNEIRKYIQENLMNWEKDPEYMNNCHTKTNRNN